MPRRLSDINVEEEQVGEPIETTSVRRLSDIEEGTVVNEEGKQVRRLSDIKDEPVGQKILGGVKKATDFAFGEGMATGEFEKMTPLGKTLDIASRPSATVKSAISNTITQLQDENPGVNVNQVIESAGAGLHGKERVSANEIYKQVGVEGVPGLGFVTEIAVDPLTYVRVPAGAASKLAKGVGKITSKIPGATKVMQGIKKLTVNTTGIKQLDDLISKYSLKREYLKGKSFQYGIKIRNQLQDIAKKTGKSIDDLSTEVVNLIELPGEAKTSIPELATLADTLKNHFSDTLTAEMKAGVPITALSKGDRGIQYFPRITTDEARQYFKQAKVGNSKIWNPKLENALKRKTGDFTLAEFNDFAKANGLESLGGNSVEQFFMKNPASATHLRGVSSAKAITSAEFIQDAGRIFGKTAKEMPYGQELPEGLTKIYPALKGKVFEPEVLDEITKTYEHIFNPKATGTFLKTFDTIQNYWKKWTLMPFAKYHLRNVAGNVWNNYLGGVTNPVVYARAMALQRYGKSGNEVLLKIVGMTKQEADDILLSAKKLGVLSGTQFALEKSLKKSYSPTAIGMNVGATLENNSRLAHFVDKLQKGLSPEDAALSVKKFLFDYQDLTHFEKQVMRRIFPFYAWTRKNIPLQLEQLINQPQKYVPLMKLLTNRNEKDLLTLKYANPKLYERLPVELRRDADTITYVPLEGLIPAADLGRLAEPGALLFDLMSPYIKTPIELLSGVSFYRKASIEKYEGQTELLLGKDVPVNLRYVLTTVSPQARILYEADRLLKKDTRKEKLTPAEQMFHQSLATVYKINLHDFKDKAMQTIYSKVKDLQNGYFWAKKNDRKFEMERIKNTINKIKEITNRIKKSDDVQIQKMDKQINKEPGVLKRLSDFLLPEAGAAEVKQPGLREYIKSKEGLPPKGKSTYRDISGKETFGRGHLLKPGENPEKMDVEETLDKDIVIHTKRAKRLFPALDTYPQDVQTALIDGVFRGEHKSSYKTTKLINSGQWDKVADEYLDNEEYRKSKNPKNKIGGIAKRMDEHAETFRRYAKKLKG